MTIHSVTTIGPTVARWRARGLRVGFTNGIFDLLHIGHLATLRFAKSHCDRLLVAVDDDEHVRALKGDGRPVRHARDRAALVGALRCVDAVLIFPGPMLVPLLQHVHPDVMVKGSEYLGNEVKGAEHAQGLLFAPMVGGVSTTETLRRMACASS